MSENRRETIIIICALIVSTILIIAMIITDYRIKQAAREADATQAETTHHQPESENQRLLQRPNAPK